MRRKRTVENASSKDLIGGLGSNDYGGRNDRPDAHGEHAHASTPASTDVTSNDYTWEHLVSANVELSNITGHVNIAEAWPIYIKPLKNDTQTGSR